jgi:hypothetical protein
VQQDTQVTKKARESSVQVVSRHLSSLVVMSRQMRFLVTTSFRQQLTTWQKLVVSSWRPDEMWLLTADDLTKNVRQLVTCHNRTGIASSPSFLPQQYYLLSLPYSKWFGINGTRARGSERSTALTIKRSPIMMPTTEPLVSYWVRFMLFNHI